MRPIEDILQHPATDAEEALATAYIWSAAARIRDGWTDEERQLRALGPRPVRKLNKAELSGIAWTPPEMRLRELIGTD